LGARIQGGEVKLIAIMPVRNEDWCLGLTARAALMWCDEIVIGLHACTDSSAAIVRFISYANPGRVTLLRQAESEWAEMAQRQRLLEVARERGATHIAMIDADEILTGNLLGLSGARENIKSLIQTTKPSTVFQLPWLALPRTTDRYLTSGIWGPGQQVSMVFKDEPAAHWHIGGKRDGRDHEHRNPMGLPHRFSAPLKPDQGGIMHLQFLSERRLRAKQALYKAIQITHWPAPCQLEGHVCTTNIQLVDRLNVMYGRAVYESDPAKYSSAPVPLDWWLPYAHLMSYLDLSETEAPWQEVELKRLIAEHGAEKFSGLDLFGVA
jgi:hypothetical protein